MRLPELRARSTQVLNRACQSAADLHSAVLRTMPSEAPSYTTERDISWTASYIK